jgi:hypothetical protein
LVLIRNSRPRARWPQGPGGRARLARVDLLREFNHSRYRPDATGGFYESYFQRANHPSRPLAFWIRYTVFAPEGRPERSLGELWAVWFDGERGVNVVAKTEVPAGQFAFARDRLEARVGDAVLEPGRLKGAAASRGHRIEWDLGFAGEAAPLFSMARSLYAGGFPKAKSLVGLPLARFAGTLVVDGESLGIDGWTGSQNHNWGPQHTDQYAYGQVAGFDNAPDSFLEAATGRVRLGPLWTPYMTPVVLRHEGREYALNTIPQALLRARGRYGYFEWSFRSRAPGLSIEGRLSAPPQAFVGLRYYNPPGGQKYCLNSKIAACRVTLKRDGLPDQTLETQHRAAFEILTDDLAHGVEIRT